jgi:hypothetical protein
VIYDLRHRADFPVMPTCQVVSVQAALETY